jgi:hypothetical protein
MYKEKGGQTFKCQERSDREITCNLPKVGEGHYYNMAVDFNTSQIVETDEIKDTDILSSSVVPEDQVWERPRPLEGYKKKRIRELRLMTDDPEYYDPELEEYREQEWHRREYGVWFMNNGKPTYLTGSHYLYLTHWRIDVGYPHFRGTDLEYYYFLAYVEQDPYSRGMIEMTKRRFGKTFRAGVFIYDYCSRNSKVYGGIQSKTAPDAKTKVFGQAIVEPFQTLPDFFIPVYDQDQGFRAKSKMSFFKTNKKGRVSFEDLIREEGEELASWIEPRSQKAAAFDGEKLHRYLRDECFKLEEEDVYDAHEVVKPCVEIDGQIIGKMLYTSTVEEFNERSKKANMLLWNMSSFDTIDPESSVRETNTGLYQFFMPDYKTMYFDKYGYPDEERGRKYFDDKREQYIRNGNTKGLNGFVRKHPRTPEEAFWSAADMCIYDAVRLKTAMMNLEPIESDIWQRGDLEWVGDPKDRKVTFKEKPHGPFYVAKYPDEYEVNNIQKIGDMIRPKNKTTYMIGVDPFDHDIVDLSEQGARPSDGAAAVYMKNRLDDPDFNENFVAFYLFRRRKAKQFYEDMLKLAVFYGAEILYENQKTGLKHHFEDNDALSFLMRYDGKRFGIPASSKLHDTIMEETENFLEDNCERVVFRRLLQDWHDYDPNDTKKYDIATATGIALIGARRLMKRQEAKNKRKMDLKKYVRTHKQKVLD